MPTQHLKYVLSLADNTLILSQRLGEWCGHGPVLEQDIAMANIALDLLGQARMLYDYAGELEGKGQSDDDFAFFRDTHQFYNVMLVEQPNQDWAYTIARQFFFDVFHFYNWQALSACKDPRLAEIAVKSLKEVTYHLRFSSEWMLRLGDGTDLSKQKIQTAVDDLWMFTGELYTPTETDLWAFNSGIAPDFTLLQQAWEQKTDAILAESTLSKPVNNWMQTGGKDGRHTEQLGFILAEMQHLQRTYPGQKW